MFYSYWCWGKTNVAWRLGYHITSPRIFLLSELKRYIWYWINCSLKHSLPNPFSEWLGTGAVSRILERLIITTWYSLQTCMELRVSYKPKYKMVLKPFIHWHKLFFSMTTFASFLFLTQPPFPAIFPPEFLINYSKSKGYFVFYVV